MRMLIPRRPWGDRWVQQDWNSFVSDVERLFDNMVVPTPGFESSSSVRPACEVNETEEAYLIEVDLPGMRREDIRIEVKDGRLWIQGERKREVSEGEKDRGYVERFYGRFERVFALPESIKVDKVEAHYENGVLRMVLPKAEKAVGRSIEVQSGKNGFFGHLLGKKKSEQTEKTKSEPSSAGVTIEPD